MRMDMNNCTIHVCMDICKTYEIFYMSIMYSFRLNSESYISRLQLTNVYPSFMLCISSIKELFLLASRIYYVHTQNPSK